MNAADRSPVRAVLVLGCGEVGRALIGQLGAQGLEPVVVDPAGGALEGVVVHPAVSAGLGRFDLILAAVPASVAVASAKACAPHLGEALYVDLSSSSRENMVAAASEMPAGRFVDAAIMGSVAMSGAKTPTLLSGERAPEAAGMLSRLGMNATAMPGSAPGDACAIKLLRSVVTKGLEAVAVEGFLAANRMGLLEALRDNLRDVGRTPFPDFLDAIVRTHVVHAPRRTHEVEAAIEQLRGCGVEPVVSRAVADRFRRTAEADRELEVVVAAGETRDLALAWLDENAR
jgi:3-hydroxyisobutyrate dehydrogenase